MVVPQVEEVCFTFMRGEFDLKGMRREGESFLSGRNVLAVLIHRIAAVRVDLVKLRDVYPTVIDFQNTFEWAVFIVAQW